jgi:serine/threonine-protein kinase
VAAISTILSEKYQLYRIFGTGRAGTIFLAVHLGLEEYRAIKRSPKSFLNFDRFRGEVLALKEHQHPGIPIVYNVEKDESNSYLIEEYLEGESNKTIVFVGFSDLLRYVCCIPKFRIHAPTLL